VSGIQHSELIANQVRSEQAVLLSVVRQEQLAAEKAGYDAMLAQAAADAKSKVRRSPAPAGNRLSESADRC
jgi:hypothetical protein